MRKPEFQTQADPVGEIQTETQDAVQKFWLSARKVGKLVTTHSVGAAGMALGIISTTVQQVREKVVPPVGTCLHHGLLGTASLVWRTLFGSKSK